MQRKTWLMGGAAAVLAAALLGWAFAPRPVAVEVAAARVAPFELTLVDDARTRLLARHVLGAPAAGQLQRIALREGDAVQAGDLLARIAAPLSPRLDARTRAEAQARVAALEAALQRAGTRVAAARVAQAQAQAELRRSEALQRQGFVAEARLDADRLLLQAAQQDLAAAQAGETIARHELAAARAALSPAGTGSGPALLRAPLAGQVLRVLQTGETPVAAGMPLIELGDLARLEVVAPLLTADALRTRPGAAVRILRWGGPGALEGRVRRIEPSGFTKISALGVEEQRVNVLIDFVTPLAQRAALGDGYRVEVQVLLRAEPRALQVPVSAVFPRVGGEAGDAVFVVEGGRARLRPVKVEARGGGQAWIAEGLREGETVIVYPPPAVADGVRVKARSV